MEMSRGMPAGRVIVRPVAQFLGISALTAAGTAALAWLYLPYERLERYTAQEQFLAWEGVVWMLALVLGFLGLACVLQVVGWQLRGGIVELVRRLAGADSDNPVVDVAAVLPWWMLTYAVFLMLIGGLARTLIAP